MSSFFLDTSTGDRYYTTAAQVEYGGSIYVRPTASTYTGLGFTEVTIQPRPDSRFYNITALNDDGSWTSTPKDLPTLKTQFKTAATTTMRSVLAGSVEEVLFAFQDGGSIPTDWANFRSGARTARNNRRTKIDAETTVSDLADLVNAQKWILVNPADPADGYQLNPDPYLDPFPLDPDAIAAISGTITLQRNGAALQNALFRDNGATDPNAETIQGVFPYDLTLRLVTNDVTLSYSMPDGYSDGSQLGTGSQDVELKYNEEVIATFTLTTSTSPQVFSFP